MRTMRNSASRPHLNRQAVPLGNRIKSSWQNPEIIGSRSAGTMNRRMTTPQKRVNKFLSEADREIHPQVLQHKMMLQAQRQAIRSDAARNSSRRINLPHTCPRQEQKSAKKDKLNFGQGFSLKHPKDFGYIDFTLRNFRQRRKRKDHESYAMLSRLSSLLVNVVFATKYVHGGTVKFLDYVPGFVRISRKPSFAGTALLIKQVLLCRSTGPISRLCRVINGPVEGTYVPCSSKSMH